MCCGAGLRKVSLVWEGGSIPWSSCRHCSGHILALSQQGSWKFHNPIPFDFCSRATPCEGKSPGHLAVHEHLMIALPRQTKVLVDKSESIQEAMLWVCGRVTAEEAASGKSQVPVTFPQGGCLPQTALLSLCQPLGYLLFQLHSQLWLHLDPLALTPGLRVKAGMAVSSVVFGLRRGWRM
jgi:hypothetical protein